MRNVFSVNVKPQCHFFSVIVRKKSIIRMFFQNYCSVRNSLSHPLFFLLAFVLQLSLFFTPPQHMYTDTFTSFTREHIVCLSPNSVLLCIRGKQLLFFLPFSLQQFSSLIVTYYTFGKQYERFPFVLHYSEMMDKWRCPEKARLQWRVLFISAAALQLSHLILSSGHLCINSSMYPAFLFVSLSFIV